MPEAHGCSIALVKHRDTEFGKCEVTHFRRRGIFLPVVGQHLRARDLQNVCADQGAVFAVSGHKARNIRFVPGSGLFGKGCPDERLNRLRVQAENRKQNGKQA